MPFGVGGVLRGRGRGARGGRQACARVCNVGQAEVEVVSGGILGGALLWAHGFDTVADAVRTGYFNFPPACGAEMRQGVHDARKMDVFECCEPDEWGTCSLCQKREHVQLKAVCPVLALVSGRLSIMLKYVCCECWEKYAPLSAHGWEIGHVWPRR